MKQLHSEILLVEDNSSDAMLTIMALKEANIANDIVHVKDGQEALDYLFCTGKYAPRSENLKPSLILLDLKMPKIDGIEVLRKIKTDEKTRSIPIAVFTASQEDPDAKECYRLGVNSYIKKPLDFESFIKVIKEAGLYWLLLNYLPSE